MPTAFIKKLAKDTNTNIKDIERYWQDAKKQAAKKFNKPISQFNDNEYAYITTIIKRRSGMKNKKESLIYKFLKSDIDVDTFLNETVESGNFEVGNVYPPGIKPESDYDPNEEVDEEDLESKEYDEFPNDPQYEKTRKIKDATEIVDVDLIQLKEEKPKKIESKIGQPGQVQELEKISNDDAIVDADLIEGTGKKELKSNSVYNVTDTSKLDEILDKMENMD